MYGTVISKYSVSDITPQLSLGKVRIADQSSGPEKYSKVSCNPSTILLNTETVEAGRIFVAISAVFILLWILINLHQPSKMSLRI